GWRRGRPRATPGSPRARRRRGRAGSREAERVRGGVAAFEMDLVRPLALERHEELRVDPDAAARIGVELRNPAPNAFRIELRGPELIERVAHVDPSAVAAHLDHLRTAVQLTALRMRGLRDYPAQTHRPSQLGIERLGHVVLTELAGAPAGDVEVLIVQAQVDVRDERRDRAEGLERWREQRRVGRLG